MKLKKNTFLLIQDGETLIFEFNLGKATADWHSGKDRKGTETFFDWCKNSYPYTNQDGKRPIENGSLSPNYKEGQKP